MNFVVFKSSFHMKKRSQTQKQLGLVFVDPQKCKFCLRKWELKKKKKSMREKKAEAFSQNPRTSICHS